MKIRIILLRVLFASWAIPVMWALIFPLAILLSGLKIAFDDLMEFSHDMWNGFDVPCTNNGKSPLITDLINNVKRMRSEAITCAYSERTIAEYDRLLDLLSRHGGRFK